MHREREGVLSLGDAQETSLGVGLLKKIVASQKEFIGRSYVNRHFPPSKKTTQQQHLKLIPHVQL